MLPQQLNDKIDKARQLHLIRQRQVIQSRENNLILINNQSLLNFASNDYFGLATHLDVKQALIDNAAQYGLGSSAASSVSGYYSPHQALEEKFADYLQRDAAILFNSGYLANIGVLSTLATRHSTVISDKLCHASLLDGIQLSGATHYRYQHHQIEDLKRRLIKSPSNALIVTESIFSMEGDIAPLEPLSQLAKELGAFLIVDHAHGIGILEKPLGQEEIPCLIVPLGKALGSMGAIVAGNKTLIDTLLQLTRSYRYTTALPPAIAAATMTSLEILQKETWRREKLYSLIACFIQYAKSLGLPLISEDLTPIKSILIGDNLHVLQIQTTLQDAGFFISAIRPPTVPNGTARIRVSLNCLHTETDIRRLLNLIASAYEKIISSSHSTLL